jgi:T5SS/PEP-CTERM-associated repeat protein
MVSNTDGYIGGGSEWNNWGELTVGSAGDGTLNMIDGGVVSSCYICYIGELPGSVGSVTVAGEGSRWSNSGDLYVGHEGDGRLATPNKNNTVTVSGRIFVLSSSFTPFLLELTWVLIVKTRQIAHELDTGVE